MPPAHRKEPSSEERTRLPRRDITISPHKGVEDTMTRKLI